MISREPKTRRELVFADGGLEGLTKAALKMVEDGAQRLHFRPFNEWAAAIVEKIFATGLEVQCHVPPETDGVIPDPVHRGLPEEGDTVIVPVAGATELSEELIRYLDWSGGTLLAPVTACHWSKRPLFLISIPKAGTHLLYRLVKAFGYHEGLVLHADASPRPGHWYYVEYSNSHTRARDFFVDTVRRSPFGNRNHPFMRSPAVVIYRNPLDILVSEANYYHKDGKTSFYGYLGNLTFEDRLSRLIDDPWLLGSIRDRIGAFIPWLELPNVIPVSFEELVGPKGGGNERIQRDLTWALQLKLHVPGSPNEFSDRIFDPESPTFFAGRIGAYREQLPPQAFEKFRRLDQDFMVALGYDGSNMNEIVFLPKRADEFRRRPLIVSTEDFEAMPIAVEQDFLGCNLVRYRDLFYAVPLVTGPIDLRTLRDEVLDALPHAATVSELKHVLTMGSPYVARIRQWIVSDLSEMVTGESRAPESVDERPAVRPQSVPSARGEYEIPTILECYRGFNIVSLRWRFYGLRATLGDVEVAKGDNFLRAKYSPEDLVIGDSEHAVKERIDLIELCLRPNAQIAALAQQITGIEGQINSLSETMEESSGRILHRIERWLEKVFDRHLKRD